MRGGGNFITQSAPTNFHQFWTQKILTPGETIEDFREVTASEKSQLEASDAKWERPPQSFIDEMIALGAIWTEKTGYFALNGITDIDYKEMRAIYNKTKYRGGATEFMYAGMNLRTNLLLPNELYQTNYQSLYGFFYNSKFDMVKLNSATSSGVGCNNFANGFSGAKIGRVEGRINVSNVSNMAGAFNRANVGHVFLWGLKCSISWASMESIDLESIQYLVNAAANTSPITVTLHPTAFARLTDELIAQAAEKQITFATT